MPKDCLKQEKKKAKKPKTQRRVNLPREYWEFLDKEAADELHEDHSIIIQKLIKTAIDKQGQLETDLVT